MPYEIIVTGLAKRDLRNISIYTSDSLGTVQEEFYMQALESLIFSLKNDPSIRGQARKNGMRSVSYRDHHFIFYRVTNNLVEILRVLHQRSSWQEQFTIEK